MPSPGSAPPSTAGNEARKQAGQSLQKAGQKVSQAGRELSTTPSSPAASEGQPEAPQSQAGGEHDPMMPEPDSQQASAPNSTGVDDTTASAAAEGDTAESRPAGVEPDDLMMDDPAPAEVGSTAEDLSDEIQAAQAALEEAGIALETAGIALETATTDEELAAAEKALAKARVSVIVAGQDILDIKPVFEGLPEGDILTEAEQDLEEANVAIVVATGSIFSPKIDLPQLEKPSADMPGAPGSPGNPGTPDGSGPPGNEGMPGSSGSTGTTASSGRNGRPGGTGSSGIPGSAGMPGTSPGGTMGTGSMRTQGKIGGSVGTGGDSELDKELNESIAIFEGKILDARQDVLGSTPPPTKDANVPGVVILGGTATAGDDGTFEENSEDGLEAGFPRIIEAGSPGETAVAKTGTPTLPVPEDIPDAQGDDIVAQQLREAAVAETDPALRDKLWEEYRKYKAGL